MRRLVFAGTIVAGLLFMHVFLADGTSMASGQMERTAMTMPSVPGEMSAPNAAGHDDGGATDHGSHDGLHIAGLCLAVLLASGVMVVGWWSGVRRMTAELGSSITGTVFARLVRRPKRPPRLADLCVLIC